MNFEQQQPPKILFFLPEFMETQKLFVFWIHFLGKKENLKIRFKCWYYYYLFQKRLNILQKLIIRIIIRIIIIGIVFLLIFFLN